LIELFKLLPTLINYLQVVPFPVKLYDMLKGVEAEGLEHVVEWCSHGRAFMVHAAKDFVDDILPRYVVVECQSLSVCVYVKRAVMKVKVEKPQIDVPPETHVRIDYLPFTSIHRYFKQSKLTSFQRQLNLYGFLRVASGRDRGAYYHPLFLRGRPDICKVMLRTRVKGGADSIIPADCKVSPNQAKASFYTLPKCPPVGRGAADTMDESDDEDDHSTSHGATGATPVVPMEYSSSTSNSSIGQDQEQQSSDSAPSMLGHKPILPRLPILQEETFPEVSNVTKVSSSSEDEQLPWIPPMEGSEPAQDEDLEQALELLLQNPEEVDESAQQQQQQQQQAQYSYNTNNNQSYNSNIYYGLSLEPRPLQQPSLISSSSLSYGQQVIPSQKVELRFPSTTQPSGKNDMKPHLEKSRSVSQVGSGIGDSSVVDTKFNKDIFPKWDDADDHQGFFAGRTFNFMDDDKMNAYENKLIEDGGGGGNNNFHGPVTATHEV